jgi:molybdate transport system substrate-binding protein
METNEMTSKIVWGFSVLTACAFANSLAGAAEIQLLHPGVLTGFVKGITPQFEKSSRHKVTTSVGTGGALTARIQKGEAADIVIVPAEQIEQLIVEKRIVPGTHTVVANVSMGIGVRKGAAKPDISTVEALKRALVAATSIGYPDPASGAVSGIIAAKMIADLGLAGELKPKVRMYGSGLESTAALARGEVELGFGQMTELAGTANIVVAGSLPAPFQNTTRLAGGIVAASKEKDAAKVLLNVLTSPAAKTFLKQGGFE